MPESVTSAFSEVEDFENALRSIGSFGLLVTARGQFLARMTRVSLSDLHMSAVEEQLPRVAFVTIPTNTVLVVFPIGRSTNPVCGGIGVQAGELIVLRSADRFHVRTHDGSHWGAMRLAEDRLNKYGIALTGSAFSTSLIKPLWQPTASAARHLFDLHAAAVRIAATRPQALVDVEAAHGLEQQLLHAIVDCLTKGAVRQANQPLHCGQKLMIRFEEFLQTRQKTATSMKEMVSMLEVSDRHLRRLCSEHLGMTPLAYERLRRLSLAQRALRNPDGAAESVSAVARLYDFRDLSRFARIYRQAFGEPPSATLRRARAE